MSTSENNKLFDLYVVTYEIHSSDQDQIETFYEDYDKEMEQAIQKRIFQTDGFKLYIREYDVWFKGDIIGPIDDKTVKLINRALYLNCHNRSWVKPAGDPIIIHNSFKTEITITVSDKTVKEINIT